MLPEPLRVLYLHGFASSPASRKAAFFSERLRSEGVRVDVPDLAQGDFEHLTISGQLELVERTAGDEQVVLIGSSLGGYLAALYAARHPEVARLILLAPAFGFYDLWCSSLGKQQLSDWQRTGTMCVFHYGAGRDMAIGYQLMEDAKRFEAYPEFGQPALIMHGIHDAVVPVASSVTFGENHSNIQLVRFDAGHEMTEVLDLMWERCKSFVLTGNA